MLMKKLLTILIIVNYPLSIVHCLHAQTTFQKTFGGSSSGEVGYAVQQTDDGGYVIVGMTGSFGAGIMDVYLVKTDAEGNLQWSKTYGGINPEEGLFVQQTNDGGYIISGHTSSFGLNVDIYLLKTDGLGNLQWSKTFGGVSSVLGWYVEQTNDGGYIITGGGWGDICLLKTDGSGNLQWSKTYGGSGGETGSLVRQTSDGGYIVSGQTDSYGAGSYDIYLLKTDSIGNLQWSKTYGGIDFEGGGFVQLSPDGGYIITGNTNSFGAGGYDIYLVKTDASGNMQWSKTYGGTGFEDTRWSAPQLTIDGGYIIMAQTNSFGVASLKYYLLKVDSIGNYQWSKTYGGGTNENGLMVQTTNDGGYIAIGFTFGVGPGPTSAYLIKTDANGNSGCNEDTAVPTVTNPLDSVSSGSFIMISDTLFVENTPATIETDTISLDVVLCSSCDVIANAGADVIICSGDSILLNASGGISYKWIPAAGLSDDTIANPVASPDITTTYIVIASGCSPVVSDTDTVIVTVSPYPLVDIGKDTTLCLGESITLDAGNQGASFLWSIEDSTGFSFNPQTITVSNSGSYFVQVTDNNCTTSDTININVGNCDTTENRFFIPNSFSPNGDGDNDVLLVRGSGIKRIKWYIYNRWGEKVFELSTVNYQLSTNNGWDGTYQGKKLNTGVFGWYVEVGFLNGDKIYRKGNVSLIR